VPTGTRQTAPGSTETVSSKTRVSRLEKLPHAEHTSETSKAAQAAKVTRADGTGHAADTALVLPPTAAVARTTKTTTHDKRRTKKTKPGLSTCAPAKTKRSQTGPANTLTATAKVGRRNVRLHVDMRITSSKARWQSLAEQLHTANALTPFATIAVDGLQGSPNKQKFDTPDSLPQLLRDHRLTPWRIAERNFVLLPEEAAYVELPVPDQLYLLDGPPLDQWTSGYNNSEHAHWADLMGLDYNGRSVRELFIGTRATRTASVPIHQLAGQVDAYRCGPRHIGGHKADSRPDEHIMWERWKTLRHLLAEVKREDHLGQRTKANTFQLFMPSWVAHSTGVFDNQPVAPLLVIFNNWGAGRFYRFATVTKGRNKGRLDLLTVVDSGRFERRP
jgi:hypothetical protein